MEARVKFAALPGHLPHTILPIYCSTLTTFLWWDILPFVAGDDAGRRSKMDPKKNTGGLVSAQTWKETGGVLRIDRKTAMGSR